MRILLLSTAQNGLATKRLTKEGHGLGHKMTVIDPLTQLALLTRIHICMKELNRLIINVSV